MQSQGAVKLQLSDYVASLSANGNVAFNESFTPTGEKSCDSIILQ